RFVLIGLCAGAYWAVNTAATDGRVIAALVVNPGAMVWDAGLLPRREAAKIGRLLQPSVWRRGARGELGASRVVAVSRALGGRAHQAARRGAGPPARGGGGGRAGPRHGAPHGCAARSGDPSRPRVLRRRAGLRRAPLGGHPRPDGRVAQRGPGDAARARPHCAPDRRPARRPRDAGTRARAPVDRWLTSTRPTQWVGRPCAEPCGRPPAGSTPKPRRMSRARASRRSSVGTSNALSPSHPAPRSPTAAPRSRPS